MQTFRTAFSGTGRRVTQIIRAGSFRLHSTHLVRQRESTITNPHPAGTSPRTDNLRHAAAGTAWVLSFAYLLAEVFTAAAWSTPYSFAQDSISSLGVTTCEVGSCSPMHDVMNSAFVALGGAHPPRCVVSSSAHKKWPGQEVDILACRDHRGQHRCHRTVSGERWNAHPLVGGVAGLRGAPRGARAHRLAYVAREAAGCPVVRAVRTRGPGRRRPHAGSGAAFRPGGSVSLSTRCRCGWP